MSGLLVIVALFGVIALVARLVPSHDDRTEAEALPAFVLFLRSDDVKNNVFYAQMETATNDGQRSKVLRDYARHVCRIAGVVVDPNQLTPALYRVYLERKGNGGIRPRTPIDDMVDATGMSVEDAVVAAKEQGLFDAG